MGLICLDASVVLKLLLAEPDADDADAVLRGTHQLIAPDLLRVEIASAISRRVRDQRLSDQSGRAVYARWRLLLDRGVLHLVRTDALIDRAFAIAMEAKHPVPDCVYIAAAESLGATVVTADRTLIERGRRVYERIELLAKAA